jgi:hypothetical protein
MHTVTCATSLNGAQAAACCDFKGQSFPAIQDTEEGCVKCVVPSDVVARCADYTVVDAHGDVIHRWAQMHDKSTCEDHTSLDVRTLPSLPWPHVQGPG